MMETLGVMIILLLICPRTRVRVSERHLHVESSGRSTCARWILLFIDLVSLFSPSLSLSLSLSPCKQTAVNGNSSTPVGSTIYVSPMGHDSPVCGRSEHAACRSLPYVSSVRLCLPVGCLLVFLRRPFLSLPYSLNSLSLSHDLSPTQSLYTSSHLSSSSDTPSPYLHAHAHCLFSFSFIHDILPTKTLTCIHTHTAYTAYTAKNHRTGRHNHTAEWDLPEHRHNHSVSGALFHSAHNSGTHSGISSLPSSPHTYDIAFFAFLCIVVYCTVCEHVFR
jgi:hypothetical protein